MHQNSEVQTGQDMQLNIGRTLFDGSRSLFLAILIHVVISHFSLWQI